MGARAERMHDLSPVLAEFGEKIVERIDANLNGSVDWHGKTFEPLKPSTIAHRIRKLPGANRRNRKGKLTAASRKKRRAYATLYEQESAAGRGGAIIKPLVDSGVMRNSNHVDPPDATSFEWSAIGYLGFHMAGTTRMAARNPTPFEYDGHQWKLNDEMQEKFNETIRKYMIDGEMP